jgi:malonyl CoA-acyl carrier protein transacylase
VLQGTAKVAQPTAVCIFMGQGWQEPGMGILLRALFAKAQMHLLAVYGSSIVEGNPKEKTIHFGGSNGQAIRQRYMHMACGTTDHPNGLLFATQFAQIALVAAEKAAHLLAIPLANTPLASIGHVLRVSALIGVVFCRGITMQRAAECDSENCCNYSMRAETIATSLTTSLLEIANCNVEVNRILHRVLCAGPSFQGVCAGELIPVSRGQYIT